MEEKPITVHNIKQALSTLGGYGSICIPEFTWKDLRIDALVVDLRTRWARGFEIKMNRGDFLRDEKWECYTQFCSSLSIVCPEGLIQKAEVASPFGLLWVTRGPWGTGIGLKWVKKPKRFQKREGLAWLWTYVRILEMELPRLNGAVDMLKAHIRRLERDVNAAASV
jgi:hypothetical protein